jgi:hypothetical protein
MALSTKSLLLYGLQITELNRSIDFRIVGAGPFKLATLRLGFYSIQDLLVEIARAMFAADSTNIYTAAVDRTVSGGLENRITISTSGAYLELNFLTGPRSASSAHELIGFNFVDYTGATSYQGSSSCGTPLVPDYVGYNYIPPEMQKKVFGNVNVSASGLKEAIVFAIQEFIQVEFRFETKAKVLAEWESFFDWAVQQRPFEFTPEINDPNTVYNVTLERSEADGKGLAFTMREMLPSFPNRYRTGLMLFRRKPG